MHGTKNQILTSAGDEAATPHGRYTFTARITVDGAHSLTVMQGPNHISEAGFTTTDRQAASAAYRAMRDAAENGGSPADLAAARLAALTRELHDAQARRDTPSRRRAAYLNDLLDALDSPAQQQADAVMLDDIADLLSFASKVGDTVAAGVSDHARPKTFRELRDQYARDIRNQRAGVR